MPARNEFILWTLQCENTIVMWWYFILIMFLRGLSWVWLGWLVLGKCKFLLIMSFAINTCTYFNIFSFCTKGKTSSASPLFRIVLPCFWWMDPLYVLCFMFSGAYIVARWGCDYNTFSIELAISFKQVSFHDWFVPPSQPIEGNNHIPQSVW